MSNNIKLFTSESVCAGHPDKICDAISDAILDAALEQDPYSRTGIEAVVGANQISLFGEINTAAKLNFDKIVRQKIKELGYINPEWGFSDSSPLNNYIHQQSHDIALGVDNDGAGDQGMMFGYACRETKEFMPLPIVMAHALTKMIDEVRQNGILGWLRPDGKAQVTIAYENDKPIAIEKVVVAVAHDENISAKAVTTDVIEVIIKPICSKYGLKLPAYADIVINGTGLWHIPGPQSDAGLTGRKIIVDGYGGYARVGGGAFSGKDPTKVDRSGAYAARYIAKNIIAAGLADKCEVGLAYAIGNSDPLMQTIETFGTQRVNQNLIQEYTSQLLDTSVRGIIDGLNLRRPIYSDTSAYGHFGKLNLPWEEVRINSDQTIRAVKILSDAESLLPT